MLAKQLQYFAGADSAGIVLGARVPVILTSRADNVRMRIGSAAVAKLLVHARRARGHAQGMTGRRPRRRAILVLNAGSSSIKFCVFSARRTRARARPARPGVRPAARRREVHHAARRRRCSTTARSRTVRFTHAAALEQLLDAVEAHLADARIVGRRAPGGARRPRVHGADRWSTREVLARLDRYVPLAPLHQPHNLAAIRVMLERLPGVPEIACFDTAFHRTHSRGGAAVRVAAALRGRRVSVAMGFTACRTSTSRRDCRRSTSAPPSGRTVVFHLGNGSSMCAHASAGAASRRRWGSPRWRACRWARAAARSTPASCCS